MPDRPPSPTNSPNSILARLSAEDFGLLKPHLEPIDLPLRMELESAGKPVKHVYFVEQGFASVVANGHGDRGIEVGLVGREGMTGLSVVLGAGQPANNTFIQLAGSGQRIAAARLAEAIERSKTMLRTILPYVHVFGVQITNTALANGRSKLEDRLARWLLMSHDRADGDELKLTHEFLAIMLGVRRPGVTTGLNELTKTGLIGVSRGVITIRDRDGLKAMTNGAYGAPEAEHERLFG